MQNLSVLSAGHSYLNLNPSVHLECRPAMHVYLRIIKACA